MGWASYAWGRSDIDAYGRRYPFDYDRRHAISAVGTSRLTRTLDLGATVRVASGFPYTPVQGLRVAAQEITDENGEVVRYVPQHDQNGLLVWTTDPGNVGDLNTGRLPVFARADMRVTFRPARWNNRVQFYVEVINVFNRKNTGLYQTTLEYDPSSDTPKIKTESAGSLPLLPVVRLPDCVLGTEFTHVDDEAVVLPGAAIAGGAGRGPPGRAQRVFRDRRFVREHGRGIPATGPARVSTQVNSALTRAGAARRRRRRRPSTWPARSAARRVWSPPQTPRTGQPAHTGRGRARRPSASRPAGTT